MHWGHKVIGQHGPVDVNREDYNAQFGVESPEPPVIPDAVLHVWEWWQHLDSRRAPGYETQAPISYTELHHWMALTGTKVTRSEIEMIVMMDDGYLRAVSSERKDQRDRMKES